MITDSWNERSYDWIWSFSRFGWRKMDKDDIRTQYDYYQTSSNMSFWMCLLCHVFWFSAGEIVWAKLTSRWGGSFSPQSIEFLMRKTLQCKDPWKTQVEDLKNTSRFQDVSYCGSSSLQQPRVSNMAYWSKLATHQECTITIHKGKKLQPNEKWGNQRNCSPGMPDARSAIAAAQSAWGLETFQFVLAACRCQVVGTPVTRWDPAICLFNVMHMFPLLIT